MQSQREYVFGPSRNAPCASSSCGSPTCWAPRSRSASRPPSSRTPSRRDDLRRFGHRRLLPGPGERRARQARPQDVPDPAVPHRPRRRSSPVARVFCDITNLDGSPFEGCPRHVLRRTLDRARRRGFSFYAAPEIEYFYFANRASPAQPPETPRHGLVLRAHGRRLGDRPPKAHACSPWRTWASLSSTPSTRTPRASTRSTCVTPTPSPWPTPS